MSNALTTKTILAPIADSGRRSVAGTTVNTSIYANYVHITNTYVDEIIGGLSSREFSKRQKYQIRLMLKRIVLDQYQEYSESLNHTHVPAAQFIKSASDERDFVELHKDNDALTFIDLHAEVLANLEKQVQIVADQLIGYDDSKFVPSFNGVQLKEVKESIQIITAKLASLNIKSKTFDTDRVDVVKAFFKENGVIMSDRMIAQVQLDDFIASLTAFANQVSFDDDFKRVYSYMDILTDSVNSKNGEKLKFQTHFEADLTLKGASIVPFPVRAPSAVIHSEIHGWCAIENHSSLTTDFVDLIVSEANENEGKSEFGEAVLAAFMEFSNSSLAPAGLVTNSGVHQGVTATGFICANILRGLNPQTEINRTTVGINYDSIQLPTACTPARELLRGIMVRYYRGQKFDIKLEFFELIKSWAGVNKQGKIVDHINMLDEKIALDTSTVQRSLTEILEYNNAADFRRAIEEYKERSSLYEAVTYHPFDDDQFTISTTHEDIVEKGVIRLESRNPVSQHYVPRYRPKYSKEGLILRPIHTERVSMSIDANEISPLLTELHARSDLGDSTVTFDLTQGKIEELIGEIDRRFIFDFTKTPPPELRVSNVMPSIMTKPTYDTILIKDEYMETAQYTASGQIPYTSQHRVLSLPNNHVMFGSIVSRNTVSELTEFRNEVSNLLTGLYYGAVSLSLGTFASEVQINAGYANTTYKKRVAHFDEHFDKIEIGPEVRSFLINPLTTIALTPVIDNKTVASIFSLYGPKNEILIQKTFHDELKRVTHQVATQWIKVFSHTDMLTDLVRFLSGEMTMREVKSKRNIKEWNVMLTTLSSQVVVGATENNTMMTLIRIQLFINTLKAMIQKGE